jgi:hypothetical protein
MDAIQAHPSVAAWRDAGRAEPWTIADFEAGHTVIQSFVTSKS